MKSWGDPWPSPLSNTLSTTTTTTTTTHTPTLTLASSLSRRRRSSKFTQLPCGGRAPPSDYHLHTPVRSKRKWASDRMETTPDPLTSDFPNSGMFEMQMDRCAESPVLAQGHNTSIWTMCASRILIWPADIRVSCSLEAGVTGVLWEVSRKTSLGRNIWH